MIYIDNGRSRRTATVEEEAVINRTSENMEDVIAAPEERISALEKQNAMLLDCLLEMSEIIYA